MATPTRPQPRHRLGHRERLATRPQRRHRRRRRLAGRAPGQPQQRGARPDLEEHARPALQERAHAGGELHRLPDVPHPVVGGRDLGAGQRAR